MGRYTSEGQGGTFKQAPAGTHLARCIKIIDIGTQHGEYLGEPTIRNQVVVQWELPNETLEIDGQEKPFIVSCFYTNSLNEKAKMRGDLEAWRGKAFTTEELLKFDLMQILGKPCTLTIVHNEKGKAQVKGVGPLMKGMVCPPAFNQTDAFWIDEWDDNKFAALPEGFKRLITASDEYVSMQGQEHPKPAPAPTNNDDIPF